MASKLPQNIDWDEKRSRNPGFHEEFSVAYTLAGSTLLNQSKTNSGTLTIAANAAGGGKLSLVTDTGANDEAYAYTANKLFVFAQNQPVVIQAQMSWTEANTNKAGIIFGLTSATVAGTLVNTTGIPVSNFSGMVLYKLTGTKNWHSCTSIGTTQVDTDLTKKSVGVAPGASATGVVPNATSDANEHIYRVEFFPGILAGTTQGEARYYIDGALMWKDTFDYTSAVAMQAIVGVKGINGTNAETLVVSDFWGRIQRLPVTALQV